MNREIKFRAGDGQKMVSPDYITREGIAYWYEDGVLCSSDVIMEWTGLEDKDGVEIHEGDILKVSWDTVVSVYFDKDHLAFRVKNKEGFDKDYNYYGNFDKIEIIGNIYEHPELLK